MTLRIVTIVTTPHPPQSSTVSPPFSLLYCSVVICCHGILYSGVCVCIVVCVYVIILICIIHAGVWISCVDYTYLWCIYVCILYICVFFCVLVLPRACESRAGLVCLLCVKCVCVCRADGYWRSKGFLMRRATWKQQLTCVNLRAFESVWFVLKK